MADTPATPPHGVDPLADDAVMRATFESAPDGLVVVAADGRILAYNTSFLQLWRFPPDMLARRDAQEMRHFTAGQMQDPQAYLDTLPRVTAVCRCAPASDHDPDHRTIPVGTPPVGTTPIERTPA